MLMILTLAKVGVRACLVLAILSLAFSVRFAEAISLPLNDLNESDLVVTISSGGYDAGTDILGFTGTSGLVHVGTGIGVPLALQNKTYGTFSASVALANVQIDSSGNLTNSGVGTFNATYTAPNFGVGANHIYDVYSLTAPEVMLSGVVTGVVLGPASGSNGSISAGIMQINVDLNGGFLGPGGGVDGDAFGGTAVLNMNLVNVSSNGLSTDFNSNFTLSGTGTDAWGIPEPSTALLLLFGALGSLSGGSRRRLG